MIRHLTQLPSSLLHLSPHTTVRDMHARSLVAVRSYGQEKTHILRLCSRWWNGIVAAVALSDLQMEGMLLLHLSNDTSRNMDFVRLAE